MNYFLKRLIYRTGSFFFSLWLVRHRSAHETFVYAFEKVFNHYPDPLSQLKYAHVLLKPPTEMLGYLKKKRPPDTAILEKRAIWEQKMIELGRALSNYEPIATKNPDLALVIVETRNHPHLEVVMKWMNKQFGHRSTCYLFGSTSNEHLVRHFPGLKWKALPADFSIKHYNSLLKSATFWNCLAEDKVFIFQTDCLILHNRVDPFLQYDYIGAPWNNRRVESGTQVGNGGCSIRSRKTMIEICQRFPDDWLPEDLYFAKYCKKLNKTLAPLKAAQSFCVENIYFDKPMALHKPYLGLTSEQLTRLLRQVELPATQ